MLPLVNSVDEVLELRAVLTSLGQELGVSPLPELGIMVETPAAAMLADRFATVADFFSIGSNDLTQYILAIDRVHPTLGRKLDGLHPAVLRAISAIVEGASLHKRWVGLCGALGSEPAAVPLLIGLGVTELSVSIPMVPEIKAQVRSLDLAACRKLAERALALDTRQRSARWSKRPILSRGREISKNSKRQSKILNDHEHVFVCQVSAARPRLDAADSSAAGCRASASFGAAGSS